MCVYIQKSTKNIGKSNIFHLFVFFGMVYCFVLIVFLCGDDPTQVQKETSSQPGSRTHGVIVVGQQPSSMQTQRGKTGTVPQNNTKGGGALARKWSATEYYKVLQGKTLNQSLDPDVRVQAHQCRATQFCKRPQGVHRALIFVDV